MATKTPPNLTPAVSPPPGVQSNLVDPAKKDWIFISCCIVVIAFSTPWVLMRFYTRQWIKPSIWWDDGSFSPPPPSNLTQTPLPFLTFVWG